MIKILATTNLMKVTTIENCTVDASPLHLVYDNIFSLSSFDCVGCSFVRRNDNSVAHMAVRWYTKLLP